MNEFKNEYIKLIKKMNQGYIARSEFEEFISKHKEESYFKEAISTLMENDDPWVMVLSANYCIDYDIDIKKARRVIKYILRHVPFDLYTIEAENVLIKYKRKKLNFIKKLRRKKK